MAIENQIDSLDAVAATRTCEDVGKTRPKMGLGQTSGTARTSRIGLVANRSRGHRSDPSLPLQRSRAVPSQIDEGSGSADGTAHVLQR